MDDAEVGPHIIFPLASHLILLHLFICLPQSISSRTPPPPFPPPPLTCFIRRRVLSRRALLFLERCARRRIFPHAAQPHAELVFFISLSVYLSGLFLIDASLGHLEHYSNAKTENHIDLHMWSHCAAVYDFLNYFKLILRHRYYHKTPLTQACDNFKGHTGFKSARRVAVLQIGFRHINAFYLMYSLRESAGAAVRRRKVNRE